MKLACNIFVFFFCLVSLIQSFVFHYDDSKSTMHWELACIAHCGTSNLENWQCGSVCQKYPQFIDVKVSYNQELKLRAFTAFNIDDNNLYISFRGTINFVNDVVDVDTIKENYSNCQGCKVHQGFYEGFKKLKQNYMPNIIQLLTLHPNTNGIVVIGHSLGGALATLSAVDFAENNIINVAKVITFGSTRVGNQQFVNYYNIILPNLTNRIVHYKDIVPHFPFQSWPFDFYHVNTEIFYNEDSSHYTICQGEDKSCSDQFNLLETTGNDHSNYMNVSQENIKDEDACDGKNN